ncbi:MAG: bifunctional adenosylcobinamide kinase/adenosylcobinamide-phosphate guanylyltransferase [Actinomycetota bacterium]|nr:bifunctional adenosylcobinamide kinase/adenosylcobinamide-phosphate guanylyltransferase [Actinomycetota bacterium]
MDINSSGKFIFLGGARSGKSQIAELAIAKRHPAICYLATAPRAWSVADADFAARLVQHQARRGSNWQSVELAAPGDLYEFIERAELPTLIDSVGGWLAGDPDFQPDLKRLQAAIRNCPSPLSFVAEEVGLSVHPVSDAGRRYVELLGRTNQAIAGCVDRAFFVVAGRLTELYSPTFFEGQK